MLVSAFTFYRGGPRPWPPTSRPPPSGIWVQACGDAHLSNFGGYAAPDRNLVVDVNDFDETAAGPLGVGRQAARGELRDRRPESRLRRLRAAPDRPRRRRRIPLDDPRPGRTRQPRHLVSTYRHLRDPRRIRRQCRPQGPRGRRTQRRQGPAQRSHARLFQAHPPSRRRTPYRQRPPRPCAARGAVLRRPACRGRNPIWA